MKVNNLLLIVCTLLLLSGCSNNSWKTANRDSSGIASKPNEDSRAIVEFYAADAFSWRGWFAVHPWIVIKEKNAAKYQVYEVTGWQVKDGLSAIRAYKTRTPDRYWFGAKPELLLSIKGERAEKLIPKIETAIQQYPWRYEYSIFPGPNSNTFVAWVALQVPELELDMPFRAIGSGYAD